MKAFIVHNGTATDIFDWSGNAPPTEYKIISTEDEDIEKLRVIHSFYKKKKATVDKGIIQSIKDMLSANEIAKAGQMIEKYLGASLCCTGKMWQLLKVYE